LERVREIESARIAEVVDVLCDAFYEYPVMQFVLGATPDYSDRLEKLVTFFAMARVYRDELRLGIEASGHLSAVALVSFPGMTEEPGQLAALRGETWAKLGTETQSRYEAFGVACAPMFDMDLPHLHLNMIGTRRFAQGTGLGGELLNAVHKLSETDDKSVGVSLSTEHEDNVPLYKHFGYEVIGTASVSPELKTWAFFRPNSRADKVTDGDTDES